MMADAALTTSDEMSRRDELAERLRWLVNLRWLALACVCVAIGAARSLHLVVSVWSLVTITATMGVLNLGFYGLHTRYPVRTFRALSAEALLQTAVDVIGLGLLLFFSGGLSNPFVFYFTFHVVIAAILLEKREAYAVAMLTTGVVVFLGIAEALGFCNPWPLQGPMTISSPGNPMLSRIALIFTIGTTLVISVYMVTVIMERLRARSQDVRRLNADLNERVEMLASAERKLAAEHQRARAILECMEEGVVVVDLQGKVMVANTAAQQSALLALQDTLRHAGCHDQKQAEDDPCLHDGDGHAHPAEGACPMGSPAACLEEVLQKGGPLCAAALALLGADPPAPKQNLLTPPKSPHLAPIEIKGRCFENTVSAVRAGNETVGLVIVSRDITDRRSLERQVFHSEKLHALGNLAAGVAHELNTPLGTILGYAQILLDDQADRPNPHTDKELNAIEDQARRCRKIVQGLLDFARKSSGGREACRPNDLALRVRDLTAHTLEMRGIDVRLDLAVPAPQGCIVAVNEIEQVLVNLVTNAADAVEMAAPQSGKKEKPQVVIQTCQDGKQALIAVEDNGPGVPAEIADQIFEPFFTTKAAGRGTGLGLSIARRIVEDHDGRLILTHRADGKAGARFEVWLKVSQLREQSLPNAVAPVRI